MNYEFLGAMSDGHVMERKMPHSVFWIPMAAIMKKIINIKKPGIRYPVWIFPKQMRYWKTG